MKGGLPSPNGGLQIDAPQAGARLKPALGLNEYLHR